MTTIQLNDDTYDKVKKFVKEHKIDYPTINNFVNRAVRDKLQIETIIDYEQHKKE